MLTTRFHGIPFTITHTVSWKGREVELTGAYPTRLADLVAACKSEAICDLVVPGRSTRAMATRWSIDHDAERREQGRLTITFHEDPVIPMRVERIHDLTVEERAQFGWVRRGERQPPSPSLPCLLFLTAAETGDRHFIGEAPALEERPLAEVALVAGSPPEVALMLNGLKVHRHLARQESGELVWLYTTDYEPLPVGLEVRAV